MAGFDRYDQQWITIRSDSTLHVIHLNDQYDTAYAEDISLPLYMRIEKVSTQYTFKYRSSTEEPWTVFDTQTVENPVKYVGLQFRTCWTSSGDAVFDIDYFKLQRSGEAGSGPEKEVAVDDFNGSEVAPEWEWYTPKEGPTYTVSDGSLHTSLPAYDSFEHWTYVDDAPQLRRTDMAEGDWAIETELENISAAEESGYWAALEVGFDQYDQLWYGMVDDGQLKIGRVGEYETFAMPQSLPLTMRLEKRGEEYTFMYKHDPQEAWTVLAPQEFAGTPQYVGLLARNLDTGSEDMNADWSYFRLESWAEEEQQMRVSQPQNNVPNGPEAVPTRNVTPTPTLAPTPAVTVTPTAVRTPTPHSGLLPINDPKPEANLVLARYDQPSIPHKGLSSLNQETVSQTIDYTYDPLGRLTAADYSTGDYYHYTYDAVGNRLSEENVTNGGMPNENDYTYNVANWLVDMSGTSYSTSYTWDLNGNLVDDEVNYYTYDPANRLASIEQGNNSYTFSYDGLGDRLQQTVNSETTNYTLDLNAGLTQVLDDGTNTYLYGVDRIAQAGGENTDYFLGDALGSVRQLADENGEITLGQSYDPYGNVISSIGDDASMYGFTGELSDSYIKLIDLRSRWYDPATGRFLNKDLWQGDYYRPLSLNLWNYADANPTTFVDPTGHIKKDRSEALEAFQIYQELRAQYNINLDLTWGYYGYNDGALKALIPAFDSKDPIGCRNYTFGWIWREGLWSIEELKIRQSLSGYHGRWHSQSWRQLRSIGGTGDD